MPFLRRFACALIVLSTAVANAQTPSASELFIRLRAISDKTSLLDLPRPFHLVVDVNVPKAKAPLRTGTIEEWRVPEGDFRVVYTFGSSSAVLLRHGGKFYHHEVGDPIPDFADVALHFIEHPGPSDQTLEATYPEVRQQTFSKQSFQCIMLDRHITEHDSPIPFQLFPSYCMDPENNLVASLNAVGQNAVRQSFGNFLDHSITTRVGISADGALAAEARVTKLSTFVPKPDEFNASSDLIEAKPGRTVVEAGIIAGKREGGNVPSYPLSAKTDHIAGTVVLLAVIGRDGNVYSLEPMSAPRADLAMAALAAVRTWFYKPYLLDGRPVEVQTTVTVHFNLN